MIQNNNVGTRVNFIDFLSKWQTTTTTITKAITRRLHLCLRSLKNSSIQLTLTVMASWACMFFKGEFLQLLMADSCRSKNCFRILSSMFFGSLFEGPRSLLLSYSGILFFSDIPHEKIRAKFLGTLAIMGTSNSLIWGD